MTDHRVRSSILAAVAAGALLLAACGDDDDGDAGADASTTVAATTTPAGSDTTTATSDAGTTPAASDVVVAVAATDSLGDVLVDQNGRTLYLFTQDNGTESACTGGCLDNWPPLRSDAPTAGDGLDASLLSSANGQVTYNGHLLYYFAGDLVAGDLNGVGIPDWYAVTPAGEAAE
jgi:predicted lipoprotein with Yx(FWY)xxD motif